MQIRKLLYSLFFILFFLLCKETKEKQDKKDEPIIPQTEEKDVSFLYLHYPQAEGMLKNIEKREKKFFSYQAKVTIFAKTFSVKREKLNLSGQIFYNHKTKKMNIELQHSFFGFKVAALKTNGKKMELKIPKKKKIISPLGEVYLNEMNLYLPFDSIYFLLSNQNLSFFELSQAKIDLPLQKISFRNNKNDFSYFYNSQNFLKKIDIYSGKQKLKANIKIKKYVEVPKFLEIKLFRPINQLLGEIKIELKINKIKN